MKDIPVADIRNFAILGHTGSGKTAVTDALAFKLGLNDRLGASGNGSSVSDFTEEEKARKISIFSTTFTGENTTRGGTRREFIFTDTPGYMDFFGQVTAAVRAADAALIVVDAASGIQIGTRRAWRCCDQNGVQARAIVITGLDKDNTRFDGILETIQGAFGDRCVPALLPAPGNSAAIPVLDPGDAPAEMAEAIETARTSLIEKAAETNDELIEKYLEGQTLSPEEIARGLSASVCEGSLVPVFFCLPLKDTGVAELLDEIHRFLPSPNLVKRTDADGTVLADMPDAPFAGLVWRNVVDPFVGQLSYVRVFSGVLRSDSEIFNLDANSKEKIGTLMVTCGKKQTPVDQAVAGDIVAIPKLKVTRFNHTLCAIGHTVRIEPIRLPSPVMSTAITAHTQADEDKLGTALSRLCDQDPTLEVERNTETHEIILKGLGDVHIDVAVNLMKSQTNVQVDQSVPKVPYRETVTALGEGHYKHKKQSGGRGQYGEVYLRVEPAQPDEEEWFLDEIVGGSIPNNFIPAVQKGVVEGMVHGAVAGYPVQNVKVHLYDGSYHDVDSSEVAFKIAGSRALREAMANAKPVLLEPIMQVRVSVPDSFMGDVNGDLNHKRGRILGMESEDDMQVVVAEVPQAELFRYAAELRSMTGGQGAFEMRFDRYDIVPANVAQRIIAETKREHDEAE